DVLGAGARGVLGPGFMADVLPELAGAGGERDRHRGSVLVPPESGGCTQGDRFPGRRAAPVPAGNEPGGHVAAGGQVQPGRAGISLDAPPGVREACGCEGRLDPGAHGAQIDPDGRERVRVKAAEQAGPGAVTGKTDDLLLNALRCDAALAQEGARWLAGRDQSEQEMLAADVTVPEPAGMLQGEGQGGEGLGGAGLHQRLPVRLPCLRCTVCLVTPSRVAMSCQDHPSARAFSTWRISSRSVSVRNAATARSPTSGSVLAAPSAISSADSMAVSVC